MNRLAEAFGHGSIAAKISAANYAEAIGAAGELLVASGRTTHEYTAEMIRVVDELGPYIVLVEGVALAHAKPGNMVLQNGLALATLEEQVDFGGGKMVSLVFALAAVDHDSHIEALGQLAELLSESEIREQLMNAVDNEQIREIIAGTLRE